MDHTPSNNSSHQNPMPERFESDTQKIVRLHLQDKNHVITEDEIRSVRVGMTPPLEQIENAEEGTEYENDPETTSNTNTLDTIEP